jgi:hypothetical protein
MKPQHSQTYGPISHVFISNIVEPIWIENELIYYIYPGMQSPNTKNNPSIHKSFARRRNKSL